MTSNECVLLLAADDYEAAVTRELLERCCNPPFPVERVRSTREACDRLSRRRFAAAIIDMQAPDSGGLSAIRDAACASAETPIIALSGADQDGLAQEALRLGVQDFLPKSALDSRTLQRTVQYARLRKAIESEMLMKAYSDGLTGVGNRMLLNDRWRRSLARSARACRMTGILVIAINRINLINHSYGHAAGDAVLRHFASVLKKTVRGSDIIARFGGDEFVVVLECVKNFEEVAAVRDKLQVRHTCVIGEDARRLDYAVSIGGAISDPGLNEDLLDALHRADIEMVRNKGEADNRELIAVA